MLKRLIPLVAAGIFLGLGAHGHSEAAPTRGLPDGETVLLASELCTNIYPGWVHEFIQAELNGDEHAIGALNENIKFINNMEPSPFRDPGMFLMTVAYQNYSQHKKDLYKSGVPAARAPLELHRLARVFCMKQLHMY